MASYGILDSRWGVRRGVLQTDQLEGKMGLEREPSECLCAIGSAASVQYRDGEVSQGGHDTWSSSRPYL